MKADCENCVWWNVGVCRRGLVQHIGDPKCPGFKPSKEDEKTKPVYAPFVELSGGRLAEECYDETAFYIVWDPGANDVVRDEKGEPKRFDDLEDKGRTYAPVVNDDIAAGLVLLPSGVEEYGDNERLFNEVERFLDYWHEELDRIERCLDVLYVFLTHIADIIPQIPFRRTLGAFGRGKTAFIDTLWAVSYRPISLSGCDSDASIARTLELWRGTSKIDEADFSNSDLYAFIIKMLNSAFDRRAGYYKRAYADDPKRFLHYYVYGPKILATRERWRDVALESRCLTKFAEENVFPRPLYRWKKFLAQAQALRNKLLLWRFRNYKKLRQQIDARIEEPNIAEAVYPEGKLTARSRVMQIVLPLSFVGFDKNLKDAIEQHEEIIDALDEETQLLEQIATGIKDIVGLNELTQLTELTGHMGATRITIPLKDLAARLLGPEPEDPAERREFVAERTQLSRDIVKLLKKKHGFSIKRGSRTGGRVLKVSKKVLKPFFDRHLKQGTPTPPNAGQLGQLSQSVSVEFLQDVKEFTAPDGKNYGPYGKGEIISIPAQFAGKWEQKGIVKIAKGQPKIERVGDAYRVRLTKKKFAELKRLADLYNHKTRRRTLGFCYDVEGIKKVLEDVEIYVDEALKVSPPALTVEDAQTRAIMGMVAATIHEICHKEGLNEKQANHVTKILYPELYGQLSKKIKTALGWPMVWKLIKCPKTDKNVSWDECLWCSDAEKHEDCPILPVREFARERDYAPNVYHVTELTHPRRAYFNRTIGYAKGWDEDSYVTYLIGKATHRAIQSAFPRRDVEIRVERDFGEFKVTGSADIISDGVLYELKTYASLGALIKRGKPEPDHVWQAQAYYSLLRASRPWIARTIKTIKIIYLGKAGRGTKQYKEFGIRPGDVSDEIMSRAKALHEALKSNTPPPARCPSWLCRYCEYTGPCEGIKHGFRKNDGTFKRYLIQHKRGVERVAEMLRRRDHTIKINPLAVSDIVIPDRAQKQRPEWDIEDLTTGEKIDVKTTTRSEIWCNAGRLVNAADLKLVYYFVFVGGGEVRRVPAPKLFGMRKSAKRHTNQFGEKGYVFSREVAEVVE